MGMCCGNVARKRLPSSMRTEPWKLSKMFQLIFGNSGRTEVGGSMSRELRLTLYAGLIALSLLAYGRLWGNDFINFDDDMYITNNPEVKSGLSGPGLRWAWSTFHASLWHPLTWLSLQFDAHFFSERLPGQEPILSPVAFHADNLFWHTASV